MGYLGSKSTIYDRVIRGTPVRRFYGEENVVIIRIPIFPSGGRGGQKTRFFAKKWVFGGG